MSADDDPVGTREVAYRTFAAEFDDADFSHRDSDEERAPSYVVTPSGAKANRIFLVGVLTEIEDVNEDMLRARIVDPTGAFVVYAGQYQPDARTFFERAEPPEFVAVSGKARTFEPDDGDRVFTSVRPEGVSAVDADTRDRWVVDAARQTIERVGAMASAIEAGADEDPAAAGLDPSGGVALALDHYGTTAGYLDALKRLALDATRVVADERDEVRPLSADPDDPSPADLSALSALGSGSVEDLVAGEAAAVDDSGRATDDAEPEDPTTTDADEPGAPATTETEGSVDDSGPEAIGEADETEASTAEADDADAVRESESATEPESASESGTASESDGESAVESGSTGGDDLGDFEPGGLTTGETDEETETVEATGDETEETEEATAGTEETTAEAATGNGMADEADAPDVGDEMYELDEDERREIEEEYGAEFSTGTEVDAPGEAGIETPGPEDLEAEAAETEGEPEAATGSTESAEEEAPPADGQEASSSSGETAEAATEPETDSESGDDPAEDVDLDEFVIDRMRELDDGSGADREELVAVVVEETGADPGAVGDAIQDALMGGQCYEPDEDTLKPI
jgi:RPA family protein